MAKPESPTQHTNVGETSDRGAEHATDPAAMNAPPGEEDASHRGPDATVPAPDTRADRKERVEKAGGKSVGKYVLSFLIMLGILALTFFLILKDYALEDIANSLRSAKPSYIAIGFGAMFIYQLCIAYNLRILLEAFSGRKLSLKRGLTTAFVGFYFNNITPSATGGQPLEMYYLSRHGYPLSHTSVVFILLSLFYNLAVLIVSGILYLLRRSLIRANLDFVRYFFIFGIVFYIVMTVALFLLVYRPSLMRSASRGIFNLLRRWKFTSFVDRWEASLLRYLDEFTDSSQTFWRDPRLILKLLLSSCVQVFMLFSIPAWAVLALGGQSGSRLFVSNVAMQAALYIASSFFPTPGAVGLTESSFVTLYGDLLGQDKIVAAMILTRVINLYGFLVVSGIISVRALFFETPRRPRRRSEKRGGPTETTDAPDTPDTSEISDTSDTSEAPYTPEIPDTPGTPDASDSSDPDASPEA